MSADNTAQLALFVFLHLFVGVFFAGFKIVFSEILVDLFASRNIGKSHVLLTALNFLTGNQGVQAISHVLDIRKLSPVHDRDQTQYDQQQIVTFNYLARLFLYSLTICACDLVGGFLFFLFFGSIRLCLFDLIDVLLFHRYDSS